MIDDHSAVHNPVQQVDECQLLMAAVVRHAVVTALAPKPAKKASDTQSYTRILFDWRRDREVFTRPTSHFRNICMLAGYDNPEWVIENTLKRMKPEAYFDGPKAKQIQKPRRRHIGHKVR